MRFACYAWGGVRHVGRLSPDGSELTPLQVGERAPRRGVLALVAKRRLGFEPSTKGAVLFFGFFHGLGLATKLQDLVLSRDGLVANMVSFNVGVEIGQLLALGAMLIAFNVWRRSGSFFRHAFAANVVLMTAGFVLAGFQLTGYLTT